MAGAPKRRARRLAQAGVDPVPSYNPLDSVVIPDAVVTNTNTPEGVSMPATPPRPSSSNVHAMPQRQPPRRANAAPVGTETRRIGDRHFADALEQLAAVLEPENVVTIERLQPTWCTGYLEDFVLTPDLAGVNELRSYLRDTYGGKVFRVSVLYANGQPAWESRINIDGPPRYEGALIFRDRWNGDKAPEVRQPVQQQLQQHQQPQQQSTASVFSDLKEVLGFAIEFATAGSRDRDDKMVAMMREASVQQKELVQSILQRDTATAKSQSFVGQLGEFVTASQAIDQVRDMLAPAGEREAPNEEGLVDGAMREAMKGYIGKAMGSFAQQGMGPITRTRTRAPAPERAPPQMQNRPGNPSIPDAVVSGQTRRS